jgi:hypothetical protein
MSRSMAGEARRSWQDVARYVAHASNYPGSTFDWNRSVTPAMGLILCLVALPVVLSRAPHCPRCTNHIKVLCGDE